MGARQIVQPRDREQMKGTKRYEWEMELARYHRNPEESGTPKSRAGLEITLLPVFSAILETKIKSLMLCIYVVPFPTGVPWDF